MSVTHGHTDKNSLYDKGSIYIILFCGYYYCFTTVVRNEIRRKNHKMDDISWIIIGHLNEPINGQDNSTGGVRREVCQSGLGNIVL